jgi:hypothetical protein
LIMIRRSTLRNRGESGYMLLAILFMLFLLILAASIAVPSITPRREHRRPQHHARNQARAGN